MGMDIFWNHPMLGFVQHLLEHPKMLELGISQLPADVSGSDGTGGNCEISTASSFSSSSIAESICCK